MVEPEAEQPRDGLGAEHRGRGEAGVAGRDPDPLRGGLQSERGDELGVELAHRDEAGMGRRA